MNDKRVAEVVVDYCSVCPEEVIRIVEGKEICLCGKLNRVTYESDIIPPDRLLPEAERVAQFRKQPPYKKQEKIVFNETSIPDWCPLPKAKGWVMSDRRVATLVVRNCRECPSAVHAIIEGKQKKVCLKLHKKGISFFAIFLPDCPLPKAKED